jgi:hypothetical protein
MSQPRLPTVELLDAAYYVRKENTWPTDIAGELELGRRFPSVARAVIAEAYARALALVAAACARAEEIRGQANDCTGVATIVLETECPGFSASVYHDARGLGMLWTR